MSGGGHSLGILFHRVVVCGEKLLKWNLLPTNEIQRECGWFGKFLAVKVKPGGTKECGLSKHFPWK